MQTHVFWWLRCIHCPHSHQQSVDNFILLSFIIRHNITIIVTDNKRKYKETQQDALLEDNFILSNHDRKYTRISVVQYSIYYVGYVMFCTFVIFYVFKHPVAPIYQLFHTIYSYISFTNATKGYSLFNSSFFKFFFLICIVGGGVKVHSTLRPLNGLLCQPRVIMIMEKSVEWLAEETEVLGENLPQYRFVHHKPHMLPVREPVPPRWEASV
jgi:hypothetical protein